MQILTIVSQKGQSAVVSACQNSFDWVVANSFPPTNSISFNHDYDQSL